MKWFFSTGKDLKIDWLVSCTARMHADISSNNFKLTLFRKINLFLLNKLSRYGQIGQWKNPSLTMNWQKGRDFIRTVISSNNITGSFGFSDGFFYIWTKTRHQQHFWKVNTVNTPILFPLFNLVVPVSINSLYSYFRNSISAIFVMLWRFSTRIPGTFRVTKWLKTKMMHRYFLLWPVVKISNRISTSVYHFKWSIWSFKNWAPREKISLSGDLIIRVWCPSTRIPETAGKHLR